MNPATHAYSFWEGIPISSRQAFGKLFLLSETLFSLVVVQRAIRKNPLDVMANLGFGQLHLIEIIADVAMSGSQSKFQVQSSSYIDYSTGVIVKSNQSMLLFRRMFSSNAEEWSTSKIAC